MEKIFHAINFNLENCKGCIKCVRICPTEALRVRNGKVVFDELKCIDCGKCAKECPNEAITTISDPLCRIHDFKHKIAIISTPFAGQFSESVGYANAKKTLYHIGFNEVIEESMITEKMSVIIRDYVRKQKIRPIISSSCPAVVRLIQLQFFELLPNILHIEAPMSVLTMYYRKQYAKINNVNPDEIGVFHIVPCTAQVAAVNAPIGAYKRIQEGAISIADIFSYAIENEKSILERADDVKIFPNGLSWAIAGEEAREINNGEIKTLAVSGIRNVVKILTKIGNAQLEDYDYVVLRSCTNGCVGGIFNVENPFVASSRINNYLRNSEKNKPADDNFYDSNAFFEMYEQSKFDVLPLEPKSIVEVGSSIKNSLGKMIKITELLEKLPRIDCAACGSPNCRAFAEDVVNGKASFSDCVVIACKKDK